MINIGEQGETRYSIASPEELQCLLRQVREENRCVVIEGAGYHRYGWTDPACLRISLAGMKRIIHFDPENLTIRVEAGLTLAELNKHLQGTGLYAPLHSHPQASIGGIIAANANGYMCNGYGSIRDVVLGAEIITPEGELVRTGGQTVKNVAGYDMTKLLIGSQGSLAIICQAVLRLYPQPQEQRTLLIRGQSLCSLMSRLWQEKLPVTALLYYTDGPKAQLAVSFHGSPLFVQEMLEQSQALGRELSAQLEEELHYTLLNKAEEEHFFEGLYRSSFPSTAAPAAGLSSTQTTSRASSGTAVHVRAGLPNEQLTPFLEEAKQLAQQQALDKQQTLKEPLIIADATRGLVRLLWQQTDSKYDFLESWQELVQRYKGYFFIEHGPDVVKKKYAYQPQAANQALLQLIKRQFDPQALLPRYW